MKLFIWRNSSFLAVAHAESAQQAREMLLKGELGEGGDGSCPERDKARENVKTQAPEMWLGRAEAFELTASAELREMDQCNDQLDQRIAALEKKVPALTAERDAARADVQRLRSCLQKHHGWQLAQTEPDQHGIVIAEAYADSGLCAETLAALAATPAPEQQPSEGPRCACRCSDAWRCAVAQRLCGQIACHCACHRAARTQDLPEPTIPHMTPEQASEFSRVAVVTDDPWGREFEAMALPPGDAKEGQ